MTSNKINSDLNWCDLLLSSPLYKVSDRDPATLSENDFMLRILSFNVLAECYINRRSHPNLPDEYAAVVFDKKKRKELLLKILKILAKTFDVLCLQELDLYEECATALPEFDSCHSRVHPRADCCAIFWRKSNFELVESQIVKFDDLAEVIDEERGNSKDDDAESKTKQRTKRQTTAQHQHDKPTVAALSGMVQCFLRRNTAAMAVLLHKKTSQKLALTSTHFYWNPGYEYVKLAQAKYLLDKLHLMAVKYSPPPHHITSYSTNQETESYFPNRIPVLVCGDLNATPGSVVHSFMARGKVDARVVAPWYSNVEDNTDQEERSTASFAKDNFNHGDFDDPTDEMFGNGRFFLFGHSSRFPFSDFSPEKINALTIKLQGGTLAYEGKKQRKVVKYMLDFTLNRLTRWLRILGLDAALETDKEERKRTCSSSKQKIPIFERCKNESRVLLTTSVKLLLRKDCPSGTYLINPNELELSLCHILLLHGITLRPESFLSRCVVCNGALVSVDDESTREELLAANNAPSLPNVSVYACRRCLQCYWWSDRPNSSASRVKNAAAHLFGLALRAGVPFEGDLGIFDFINPEAEKGGESKAIMKFPRVEAFEWLKSSSLRSPFKFKSAYNMPGGDSELLPFTNVTSDFINTLDYIFYEPRQWIQIAKLDVPTTLHQMNYMKIPNGHLLPSNIWPSDHLAVGSALLFRGDPSKIKDSVESSSVNGSIRSRASISASLNGFFSSAKNPISPANRSVKSEDNRHKRSCQCGCVPKNMFSLFEMAEMRKQLREQKRQDAINK